ncbi:MAG: hypothetical protein K2J02_01030 [Malacoplasma sp.]|nr:hypothetical protein [Malacoplasma sp.]
MKQLTNSLYDLVLLISLKRLISIWYEKLFKRKFLFFLSTKSSDETLTEESSKKIFIFSIVYINLILSTI